MNLLRDLFLTIFCFGCIVEFWILIYYMINGPFEWMTWLLLSVLSIIAVSIFSAIHIQNKIDKRHVSIFKRDLPK